MSKSVILAIYRQDENVTGIEDLKDRKDYVAAVDDYNQKGIEEKRTVEVKEFADGSLEAHLYSLIGDKRDDFRKNLKDIDSAIDNLIDDLSWLRHELSDMW